MNRLADSYLRDWKDNPNRQPLLLRGARQVGKTYAVRRLGETYPNFVEINLELSPDLHVIFEKDLDPARICRELSVALHRQIVPGSTLLFFDEIQVMPRAVTALRYFYEMMPNLHVIAAGSLLDFAIEQVGIPVGRVQSLYMYPLSFIEFLAAVGDGRIVQEIMQNEPSHELGAVVHTKLLRLLGEFCALGGMPAVVHNWITKKDPLACTAIQQTLIDTYRQDFAKYARRLQIKYVELVFKNIPLQLGGKFRYSAIEGDYRKRELAPALELLATADVAHQVYTCSGQGMPMGAQIDPHDYKVLFIDVGLAQAVLKMDIAQWFLRPETELVNRGALVESFVGQELLAYAYPHMKHDLHYWHKEAGGQAEVDYLLQRDGVVVPVEVKAGTGRTMRSMNIFLDTHAHSPYGMRFCTQQYSQYNRVYTYPLYAIAKVIGINRQVQQALAKLVES